MKGTQLAYSRAGRRSNLGDSALGAWHEYAGNIHMHTVHSDGTGTFEDLRAAGHQVGLDFIVVTDHNVLVQGQEGYNHGLLVLVGVEINDPALAPKGNHLLCLGIRENPVAAAADPQALIDTVNAQGGLSILAHPIERASPLISQTFPWRNWEVTGYQGVELWNYMAELRQYVTSKPRGLLITFVPALFSTGPLPEMLARWDELTQTRRVIAIGGSDAHAIDYQVGPLTRRIFPYAHCFRAVNTHVLCPAPLADDLAADGADIYAALRAGHCWTGYDLIGNTRGFRFSATSGDEEAIMGDRLQSGGLVRFHVRLPAPADVRLLRNGQIVTRSRGRELAFASAEPGVYRVEAWRSAWFKPRGWIFSNPIWVE